MTVHALEVTYTGAAGWTVACSCGARHPDLFPTFDAADQAHRDHRARALKPAAAR